MPSAIAIRPNTPHRPHSGRPDTITTAFKVHDALLALAMYLLPFSLGSDVVVISYAFPVFVLLSIYYAGSLARASTQLDRRVVDLITLGTVSVIIMAASSFMSEQPLRSLSRVLIHAIGLLMFIHFCRVISPEHAEFHLARFKRLTRIMARSGAIMALYYLINIAYQSVSHGLEQVMAERWMDGLASLTWGASNTVASTLLIAFGACLVSLAERTETRGQDTGAVRQSALRVEWIAYTVIIAVGILATVSRNAIAVMAILYASFILRRLGTGALIAGVAAAGLFVLSIDLDLFSDIFEQRIYGRDVETLNNRLLIWNEYWDYIMHDPFSPIGYYNSLFTFGQSGHNFSLTTYIEQSVVGWAVAGALFIALVRKAMALSFSKLAGERNTGRYFVASLIAIAINVHFEDPNFTHQYILYWWFLMGLVCYRFSIMNARSRAGVKQPA
jgi:hypothetical protein